MKFTLLIHIISWILALVLTLLTPENGFVSSNKLATVQYCPSFGNFGWAAGCVSEP